MARWLQRSSQYGSTAVLTFALWLAFVLVQGKLTDPCMEGSCHSFAAYERHDPFCIIDPTCVSPFYRDTLPTIPHWEGVIVFDGLSGWGNGRHVLALPNYIAFILVGAGLVIAVVRYIRRPSVRRLALFAIYAWCTYTVMGWFAYISYVDPTTPWINPESLAFLLGSLSILTLAARVAGGFFKIELSVQTSSTGGDDEY